MERSEHFSVKKLFIELDESNYIELDESNYISIMKNSNDISFYICQPQVCLRLSKDEILTLLSLKAVIEEMIEYLSNRKSETLV